VKECTSVDYKSSLIGVKKAITVRIKSYGCSLCWIKNQSFKVFREKVLRLDKSDRERAFLYESTRVIIVYFAKRQRKLCINPSKIRVYQWPCTYVTMTVSIHRTTT